jgi:replicative DNA helicase
MILMPTERGLPANLEAERLVLGQILLDESHFHAAEDLSLDDYSIEKHKLIWKHILALRGRGERADRITVSSELMKAGKLDSVGGIGYLISLDDTIPQVPNIEAYVRMVRDASTLRRLILAAEYIQNQAMLAQDPAEDILGGAIELIRGISDGSALGGKKAVSTREMIEQQGVDGLLSPRRQGDIRLPWSSLNKALNGLSGGQMIVLLGETSRGKSSFALQLAGHVSQQHQAAVIWTMEMSPRAMFQRLVTQMSGVYNRPLLAAADRQAQHGAVTALGDDPVYFDATSRSVASFSANLRRIKHQTRIGLVIVDYVQLIRSNSRESRAQQVAENSRNLKLAAMDFNVPFLVLSQVDRSSVKGKDARIGLHSAKESGDIENDADVMLWIEAGELSRDQPTPVSVVVGKQREGPAGFPVRMAFLPESQIFVEVEED